MTEASSKPAVSKRAYEILMKVVTWFIFIDQVRKQLTDEADVQLTDSIRQHGVLQPLGARQDGRLVWGHRRLRCAIAAGLTEVPAVILHKDMTEGEYLTLQMLENVQRENLSAWDMYQGCLRLLEAHPGMQGQELAKLLSMSPAMVSKWLSPSKTIPTVQAAFREGRIPLATVYDISKVPHEQQAGLLALRLGGASVEQMARAARKPHTTVTVKLSRVKLPLPDGAVVAVSASGEVDTAGLLEILDAAREAVKKADKDHLDVATLAKVMTDKAKAGK